MADISVTTARKLHSAADPTEAAAGVAPAAQGGKDHSTKEPCWDLIELLFFAYRDFVSDPDEV